MFFDIFSSLCASRKISTYKACTDIGLNRSAVAKWKAGAVPNGTTIAKLADYFGVSVGYLLGTEKEEKPLVNEDEELTEYLEELKNRPEKRMLFSVTKNATKAQIEAIVKMIEEMQN